MDNDNRFTFQELKTKSCLIINSSAWFRHPTRTTLTVKLQHLTIEVLWAAVRCGPQTTARIHNKTNSKTWAQTNKFSHQCQWITRTFHQLGACLTNHSSRRRSWWLLEARSSRVLSHRYKTISIHKWDRLICINNLKRRKEIKAKAAVLPEMLKLQALKTIETRTTARGKMVQERALKRVQTMV